MSVNVVAALCYVRRLGRLLGSTKAASVGYFPVDLMPLCDESTNMFHDEGQRIHQEIA